jgi:hypothetical protein
MKKTGIILAIFLAVVVLSAVITNPSEEELKKDLIDKASSKMVDAISSETRSESEEKAATVFELALAKPMLKLMAESKIEYNNFVVFGTLTRKSDGETIALGLFGNSIVSSIKKDAFDKHEVSDDSMDQEEEAEREVRSGKVGSLEPEAKKNEDVANDAFALTEETIDQGLAFGGFSVAEEAAIAAVEGEEVESNTSIDRVYCWKDPNASSELDESRYIEIVDGNLKYYGTSDLFDGAREGYYPGFFAVQGSELFVGEGKIAFKVKVSHNSFYSTNRYHSRSSERWINSHNISNGSYRFEGVVADESISLQFIEGNLKETRKFELMK